MGPAWFLNWALDISAGREMNLRTVLLALGMAFSASSGHASERYWMGVTHSAISRTLVERNVVACQQMKWRVSDDASYKFIVRCTEDGSAWVQYEVIPSMNEVKGPDRKAVDPHPEETATVSWENMKKVREGQSATERRASRLAPNNDNSGASSSDIDQANRFLADLPPACSRSYKSVDSGGTVSIRVICSGNGQSVDGLVAIKNGVVTKIR
jgi:hypothetical protein